MCKCTSKPYNIKEIFPAVREGSRAVSQVPYHHLWRALCQPDNRGLKDSQRVSPIAAQGGSSLTSRWHEEGLHRLRVR